MDPIKDSRTKFIFYSRKQPFSISEGELLSIKYENENICAKFRVSNKGPGYDPENDRTYIEIVDANGKPTIEGWVPMNNLETREGNLWLREKS